MVSLNFSTSAPGLILGLQLLFQDLLVCFLGYRGLVASVHSDTSNTVSQLLLEELSAQLTRRLDPFLNFEDLRAQIEQVLSLFINKCIHILYHFLSVTLNKLPDRKIPSHVNRRRQI